jgi:beta-galactosidase/beta-glucuronidase
METAVVGMNGTAQVAEAGNLQLNSLEKITERFGGQIPRSEYPRPQFAREKWMCLNGEWEFEIDHGDSGYEREVGKRVLKDRILVPFCPEAPLSGVHNTDFMDAVWYRKVVTIPREWKGQQVLLHFGAVDYDATVWVNDVQVGRHRGGFTPFTCNLKNVAKAGEEITIVVRARDYYWTPQPRGKQAQQYGNTGCMYYRTTGIWQTVWLEPVPDVHLRRSRLTPDVANGVIVLDQPLSNNKPGFKLRATMRDEKGVACREEVRADLDLSPRVYLKIPADRQRLWSTSDPHLYDITIELLDARGRVLDKAESYAGLRSVSIDGQAIKINGETVFQRLVLDQGFYRDGIMTAPTDEALKADIELSIAAGFNGARLHQKVFEERFLYWADKLGYLCWGEFADWGCRNMPPNSNTNQLDITFAAQWNEALERDYSHPCIIGWCALNETWESLTDRISSLDDATWALFKAAKNMDPTRPVLDASGYSHRVMETDVYDSHDYEQDPKKFARNHAGLKRGKPFTNNGWAKNSDKWSLPYDGQPYFVSEFGGIHWNPNAKHLKTKDEWWKVAMAGESWGYGKSPMSFEEFYERFEGLCGVLLDNPHMFGYCYTQLTDVYQEENGLYTFEREPKFDLEKLRAIQTRRAAIEEKFNK